MDQQSVFFSILVAICATVLMLMSMQFFIKKFNIKSERVPNFFNELRNFVLSISEKGNDDDKVDKLSKSRYDTKYFNEKFIVRGRHYSGYDGLKILDQYTHIRNIDFSSNSIDIHFDIDLCQN